MNELDPGHIYSLSSLDGNFYQQLTFVKREGPGYPGNVGSHSGTTCQEVIRALIFRVKYFEKQISCDENAEIINHLRSALLAFEVRAAKRHGILEYKFIPTIEDMPTCSTCGHIACEGH